jgi:hypothetical protein
MFSAYMRLCGNMWYKESKCVPSKLPNVPRYTGEPPQIEVFSPNDEILIRWNVLGVGIERDL